MISFNETARKVLSSEQQSLKPLLEEFSKTHILVGGTAIALFLGHRRSIDFDFFCFGPQGTGKVFAKRIASTGLILDENSFFNYLSDEEESEVEFFVQGVKVQLIDFSRNPYNLPLLIPSQEMLCEGIPVPSLLDLASLKLYAMMYRKKWKDVVDLYFLLKDGISFVSVMENTHRIFHRLFKEEGPLEHIQEGLWDKTEAVEYLIQSPPLDEEIEKCLIQEAQNYIKNA